VTVIFGDDSHLAFLVDGIKHGIINPLGDQQSTLYQCKEEKKIVGN